MFRRKRSTEDFAEEIKAHLDLEADELRSEGLSEDEAHRNARAAFGSVPATQERFHMRSRLPWFENLLRDITFAMRQIVKNPGFAAVVIFTLALGIGASTSIFSVADAVLLRPLPYPNPEQLVRVWEQMPNGHRPNLAESNFEDFLTQNNTFASLAAYDYGMVFRFRRQRAGACDHLRLFPTAFSHLSASSRCVAASLQQTSSARMARRQSSSVMGIGSVTSVAPTNLSKFHLDLEGGSYPVVGVMPPSFDFPSDVAAWIPRELDPPGPSRTRSQLAGCRPCSGWRHRCPGARESQRDRSPHPASIRHARSI